MDVQIKLKVTVYMYILVFGIVASWFRDKDENSDRDTGILSLTHCPLGRRLYQGHRKWSSNKKNTSQWSQYKLHW